VRVGAERLSPDGVGCVVVVGAENSSCLSCIAIRISDGGRCVQWLLGKEWTCIEGSTYVAGVQAASEAALLLDFLGHVCCGVSRRRPLPGKRGTSFERAQGTWRISSAKLRVRLFACAPLLRLRQAFPRFPTLSRLGPRSLPSYI
jgi:hypothetical protein